MTGSSSSGVFLISLLLLARDHHHHHGGCGMVMAFPTTSLKASSTSSQRVFSPRTLVTIAPAADQHEEAYDMDEFLEEQDVNFTASVLNGMVIHNSPHPTDPLQSMSNLTQKLRTLSTQIDYQLSLAKDDHVKLEYDLEQARADRQKLQSLIKDLRKDKEALAQTLNETQTLYKQEREKQTAKIQSLQSSLSQKVEALQTQQAQAQTLQATCSAQEERIQDTESSARRLLALLWRLLQRRIRNWFVFIFPIVFRLLESLLNFFIGVESEEEEYVEAASSRVEPS